ncbi:MAG: alpha/beta hydrolase [Pseudomonadota bacterium]
MNLILQLMNVRLLVASIFGLILLPFSSLADENLKLVSHAEYAESTQVNENLYVQIGGIKQWITIRGKNYKNPVLLIIHGGPGNPLSLYAENMYPNWDQEFTVVHWDQRGAGKTFEINQATSELTYEELEQTGLSMDLMVHDGLEITDYLRTKFKTEKIIISGSSWGSALALTMVKKAPEKYYFYVGLSQLVNYQNNLKASYELVLSKALSKGRKEDVAVLKAIGAPPWVDPKSFGKLRRIIRAYENQDTSNALNLVLGKEYLSQKSKAAYQAGEDFSYVKFVGLRGNGMALQIALDKCCIELKIPIYIIQGEKDLLTTPKVTKQFFEKINAPAKTYINVTDCGHDPNLTMLNKQLNILKMASKKIIYDNVLL